MKSLNNSVNLIGNLGQNVEIVTFKTGNKKANVSLATTSYYKNTKGELQKDTQWHNLIAWGLQAELMGKAMQKGSMVAIKGSLQYRTYETQDGAERKITEVLVDEFMLMPSNTSTAKDAPIEAKAKSGGKKVVAEEELDLVPF